MTADWIEPADFASVPLHSTAEHACMPPLQGYDAQLRITAPTKVRIRADHPLAIPVCARGILPAVEDPQKPGFVAKDVKSGKVYRGIAFDYSRPPLENVEVDPTEPRPFKKVPLPPGLTIETRFSTDMVRTLNLPTRPANYEVYIEVDGIRSNQVNIEVEEAK